MKAISRQGRNLSDNRFAATFLRHMLNTSNAKNFPGNSKKLMGCATNNSSLKKKPAHAARNSSLLKKYGPKSANDAAIEQLAESLGEAGAILPAQEETVGKSALRDEKVLPDVLSIASVLPLEHRLVIVYITSCRQDNQMIYVSPQIANLGFSPVAWIGKTDLRLQHIHQDDIGRVTLALQHSRDTGEKFDCCYRLYDSNGKIRWFHDEASVARDESGSPLFVSGVMLDITDKKEMETELHEHRYCLEQHVELRTRQLMKRITLLESCNTTLCDKLAAIQKDIIAIKKHRAAPAIQPDQIAQPASAAQTPPITETPKAMETNNGIEQLDGISVWARNMIGWRVTAAGSIT